MLIAETSDEGRSLAVTKTPFTWTLATDLDRRQRKLLQNPEHLELLQKWDIVSRCRFGAFRYDQRFEAYSSNAKGDLAFLQSLFDSSAFRQQFNGLVPNGYYVQNVERVPASVVSMNIFNVFRKFGAVYGKDTIAICPEVFLDNGIICENQVKRCLFDEDHEGYGELDHREFIVQLMEMMVLGGPFCQYEDEFQMYADVVKAFYKSLMSVVKDADESIRVTSTIYRIRDAELFPEAPTSSWNRCYVIIDSALRQATFLYMPRSDRPW